MVRATSNLPAAIADNRFAIDLYAQLREGDGNICISPFSVSSVLAMSAAGASGKTADQILSVLHWTGTPGDLPAESAALTSSLLGKAPPSNVPDDQPRISIANALFSQHGYPYQQPFLDLLAHEYEAPLQDVDFINQPQQACDQINHWAATKTNDKIKNAIPSSAITPLTRLVLIDAIYFKANWQEEFRKSATREQPFFSRKKEPISVPLMHQAGSFQYLENDSVQVIELPYQGDYSLVVALPRTRDGLPAVEKLLTAESVDGWIAGLAPQRVQTFLPRFKFDGSYELNDSLSKLGMPNAFSRQDADFSKMTSAERLFISLVIHKTFISVDEAGTEAAAVTAAAVRAALARSEPETKPIIFRADHPFLYILRHRPTGTILFMGRVTDPK